MFYGVGGRYYHRFRGAVMTCTHTTTDHAVNRCDLFGWVERRVCFNCSKNTAPGWPAPGTLPPVPVITPHGSRDPAVQVHIARREQTGGCCE